MKPQEDVVSRKHKTRDQLISLVRSLQKGGERIGWTNGCFDLLHAGHVRYLFEAARQVDRLVLGLNSDESISRIKGPTRPVVPQEDRLLIMSALECIDYVTVFYEDTTVPSLEQVRPDTYFKGGDYAIDTINQEERCLVEGYGGQIVILSGVEGRSTTEIIERIQAIDFPHRLPGLVARRRR